MPLPKSTSIVSGGPYGRCSAQITGTSLQKVARETRNAQCQAPAGPRYRARQTERIGRHQNRPEAPGRGNFVAWLWASGLVLDPGQDVLCHRHELALLVHHLDVAARAALARIDLDDGVGEGERVANVDGTQKTHLVIPQRDGGLVAGGAVTLLDRHRGAGRGEAQHQRAMGDAPAVLGTRHVLLVDVIDGEVAGNPGEKVDVGLAHRLGEGDAVAGLDVEILFHGGCAPVRAPHDAVPVVMMRSSASARISELVNPSSANTSAVCAPSCWGGRSTSAVAPS